MGFHVVAGRLTQSVHSAGRKRGRSARRFGVAVQLPPQLAARDGRRAGRPRSGLKLLPALPTAKRQSFARSVSRDGRAVKGLLACVEALTQAGLPWATSFFPGLSVDA